MRFSGNKMTCADLYFKVIIHKLSDVKEGGGDKSTGSSNENKHMNYTSSMENSKEEIEDYQGVSQKVFAKQFCVCL